MTPKDGGPAFPTLETRLVGFDQITHEHHGGMSLRDYFAAKVIAVLVDLDAFRLGGPATDRDLQIAAARCYRFADAMLAERDK